MLKFGPQTQEFATFLSQAENLTLKQAIQMDNLINQKSVIAWETTLQKLSENNINDFMMIRQTLNLYEVYYPKSILQTALGIAGQHVVNDETYQTLTSPWTTVVGAIKTPNLSLT